MTENTKSGGSSERAPGGHLATGGRGSSAPPPIFPSDALITSNEANLLALAEENIEKNRQRGSRDNGLEYHIDPQTVVRAMRVIEAARVLVGGLTPGERRFINGRTTVIADVESALAAWDERPR